jgi:dihydrofolate synthase/folylpolyglutamate synthase
LTLLDGAHNPHGAAALASELPAATEGRRPVVGVVAILADKDVDGVIDALAPHLDAAVATRSSSGRALDADVLAARIAVRGVPAEAIVPPEAAIAVARARAGRDGVVVVSGSLSLLADLARTAAEAR